MSGDIGPKCIESFWDRNSESHRVLQWDPFSFLIGTTFCLFFCLDNRGRQFICQNILIRDRLYMCVLAFFEPSFLKSLTQNQKLRATILFPEDLENTPFKTYLTSPAKINILSMIVIHMANKKYWLGEFGKEKYGRAKST